MPRRILLTALTVMAVVAAFVLPGSVAAAATGCVPTTGSTGYTVTVCITAPTDGAVLTGPTTVSATAAITNGGGTLRVSGVTFCFDTVPCSGDPSKYLLKDFGPDASGSFTFTLDTTLFADRTATLYAFAEMNDGLVSQAASESVTINNGQTAPAPIPTGFSSTAGTAPGPNGLVVAAVGDGADGRPQTQQVSDLIAGMNPNMFLYLGDVYEKGSAAEFQNYYATQFGRFDSITNPTIGNHEYSSSSTAEGYFRYWRSPPNYYSYDAGGWHFVSLNSDDHFDRSVSGQKQTLPGTGGVRTMYDWLADDLTAHPTCTIVYYHHPLWNQGEESPSPRMQAIWSLLVQKHVSLVLNGHDHDYQRFPAVDGAGNPSPTGVTEIISGGGGHGTQTVTPGTNPGPNPVVSASALGALRLTLHPDRADFVATGTTGQLDNGSVPCQSAGTDTVPPTKPVLATPVASTTPTGASVALSWTASTDDRGVAGYRVRRDGTAVSGDLPASALTFTDTPLQPSTQYTYTVEAFDSFGNTALSDPQTVTTPGTGQVVIQAPGSVTQDTYVSAASPAAKGSATTVKVSSAASTSGQQITYLKFNVTGTSGIGKATLMLNPTSTSSAATATVYAVADTTWSESTMTYPLRPAIGAAAAVPPTAGIAVGVWKSWDVTDLVLGNGTVSFALQQTGTNSTAMSFNSKEATTAGLAPKLVIDPPTGTTPSTPTGLAATATSQTTVALSWRASTSGAVDHYDVFRDGTLIATAPPVASPSYTDTTAVASTTYAYSVAAVDAAGSSSAQTAAVQVTTPAADTTGPTVVSTTPSDGATGVAVATNATATFSEALAPATVTDQTFTLTDAAGTAVPAIVTYDAASTTATLNPGADLAQGTTYTATIKGGTGGVTDAAGNPVVADTPWSFSTVAAPAPVASFTATPTSGQAPLAVQFTDTSTGNPTTWSWNFGDGTTATTQSPAHTYTAAGTYTVTLTAAIGTGPSTTANGTVTVTPPPPTASFTATPTSGRAPLPVQFTDTSTGATAWSWNFGDGTTATTQSPAHTYATPGSYTVTLTASNATGPSAPVTATVTATGVKVGASTTATGNSTGVAIPRPAGVANGDVLVMQLTAEQNPTLSTLAGWTAIPSTPLTVGTGIREFALYHVVTNAAAEPASYSWTLSAKLKWGTVMTAFSGVSTASPLETATSTQVGTAAASSLTVPGVTTTGTGAMLIGAIGLNNPGTAATPPTGWTVGADSTGTQRAVLAYRYVAAPAASGNLTWALSKSAPSGGWLLALHAAG